MKLFPGGPSYRIWAVVFSVLSFLIANLGLNAIIAYSMPVLMFLYPLAIVLIALTFSHRIFGGDRIVYQYTMAFTAFGAIFDFLRALPEAISASPVIARVTDTAATFLPFSEQGFGWVCLALAGFAIGLLVCRVRRRMLERE